MHTQGRTIFLVTLVPPTSIFILIFQVLFTPLLLALAMYTPASIHYGTTYCLTQWTESEWLHIKAGHS